MALCVVYVVYVAGLGRRVWKPAVRAQLYWVLLGFTTELYVAGHITECHCVQCMFMDSRMRFGLGWTISAADFHVNAQGLG